MGPCTCGVEATALVATPLGLLPAIEVGPSVWGWAGPTAEASPVSATTRRGPALAVLLANGALLRCSPDQYLITDSGTAVRASALRPGLRLALFARPAPATAAPWEIPASSDERSYLLRAARARTVLPVVWTEELGHLLGWLLGDGSVQAASDTLHWIYSDEDAEWVLERHRTLLAGVLGAPPKRVFGGPDSSATMLRAYRRALVGWVVALGFSTAPHAGKVFPLGLLSAPPAVLGSALRGLFDADGTVDRRGNSVSVAAASPSLAATVRVALASLGVASTLTSAHRRPCVLTYRSGRTQQLPGGWIHEVTVTGSAIDDFAAAVGFDHPRKRALLGAAGTTTRRRPDPTTRVVSVAAVEGDLELVSLGSAGAAISVEGLAVVPCGPSCRSAADPAPVAAPRPPRHGRRRLGHGQIAVVEALLALPEGGNGVALAASAGVSRAAVTHTLEALTAACVVNVAGSARTRLCWSAPDPDALVAYVEASERMPALGVPRRVVYVDSLDPMVDGRRLSTALTAAGCDHALSGATAGIAHGLEVPAGTAMVARVAVAATDAARLDALADLVALLLGGRRGLGAHGVAVVIKPDLGGGGLRFATVSPDGLPVVSRLRARLDLSEL